MPSPRSRYLKARKARIAAGTWQPLSDGAQGRAHVARLCARGATLKEIAAAAGLSRDTVAAVAAGQGQVQAATEAAILAVQAGAIAPRVADAAGTRLRLRALGAMGHTPSRVAWAAGLSPGEVREIAAGNVAATGREIRAGVARVYEQWWDKRPAVDDRAAEAVRRRAARDGWLAPMALDDARLDEPGYSPRRQQWRAPEGTGPAEIREMEREAG